MRIRSRARAVAVESAVPIALVLLVGVLTARSTGYYYPPLTDVIETFADTWLFERVQSDVVPSLSRMALGFAIACAAGSQEGWHWGRHAGCGLRPTRWCSSCAPFRPPR